MAQCPACTTHRVHTEAFDKMLTVIVNGLRKWKVSEINEDELAMALSVLVADALKIDIYQ